MKIEKQVCSLELSKKLEELGVSKHCLFYWELNKANKYFKGRVAFGDPSIDNSFSIPFPAYTVAELGEMLPNSSIIHNAFVALGGSGRVGESHTVSMLRDPDFIAEMLIWLIENNHVDVAQVNEGAE